MLYRSGNLVRFWIKSGPEWDSYRSHDGEMMQMQVMKKMYKKEGGSVVMHDSLMEPVTVRIKIDYVASPIHDLEKNIHGKIVGGVERGQTAQDFHSNAKMLFFTDGAEVIVRYFTDTKTGFIIFEGAHWNDEAWVRLCLHDGGWISSLEHKKPKLNDTEMGHCYEIAYFARLKETATDCKIIQRTTDIKKYSTLNEDDPSETLFYNPIEESLIWKDLPIVWA